MKFIAPLLVFTTILSANVNAKALTYSSVKDIAKEAISQKEYRLIDSQFADMKDFCPSYNQLSRDEKEDFYAHLLATMAIYESGLNPNTTFKENNGNISAGLLQISYGSLNKLYKKNGCSVIESANDLTNPKKNLQCGLAIISTLANQDGYLALNQKTGASRYWSVLRTPYSVFIKSLNKTVNVGKRNDVIKNLKKSYPLCR